MFQVLIIMLGVTLAVMSFRGCDGDPDGKIGLSVGAVEVKGVFQSKPERVYIILP